MKAVKIVVDVPPKYINAVEDRAFLKVGQKLTGAVVLDGPGKPKSREIRWLDAHGRLLGRTAGTLDAYQRRITFEFNLDHSWFPVHYIECDLDGVTQPMRERFFVAPTSQGWETLPAVTWATYPYGEFYDKLQEVGVNAITAYKMAQFDHVVEHGMRFYVDQCTFDEISTYHRPFRQFWEPPADYTGPVRPSSPGYGQNWNALLEKYARVRERCKKEGRFLSRDEHYRKVLFRVWCPNDPGTRRDAGERFEAVVRQHKGFRPLFQNIADEAGITDQSKPFDFCYCPYCMDKFRLKLEQKYGSLAEMNRQWGTDFSNWYDVYPLTTDETMDANDPRAASGRKGSRTHGKTNGSRWLTFASWADHREFMDDTFVGFFEEMRRIGRSVDPIGTFSQGGCQWPEVYGGWDYTKVVRTVDALIPYNGGGNQEIIRSIAPHVKNISPFFGDDERQVRQMWFSVLHGDAGLVFWDNDEKKGRFVARPGGRVVRRGRLFGPALREFRGGVGQQLAAWGRKDDPIGMLYSQPSERAHWMLEALAGRKEKEWFRRFDSRHMSVRMSWQQLIEDRQLQYRYISYLEMDEGTTDLGQFKMIVLPESLALSAAQITALRQFVCDGGTLVADGRVGRMADNCRQAEVGLLDDLFGIRQGGEVNLKQGPRLQPVAHGWVKLDKQVSLLAALDGNVRLVEGSGAEAAARAGAAPAIVRRKVGAGWTVYLNVDLARYEIDRHELGKPRGQVIRGLLDAVAALAGIAPAAMMTEQTLGTTAGIELTRFEQRGAELFAAIMNRQFRQSGIGEKMDEHTQEVFETDRKVTLSFPGAAHTYNARKGKYLGKVDRINETVPRLTPLLVARLPYRVRGVEAEMASRAAAGDRVELAVRIKADRAAGAGLADHVVRVDVYQPDGTWCYWYSDNVLARGGCGAMTIPLALNDPAGAWTIAVRDSVTGSKAEKTLRVAKS